MNKTNRLSDPRVISYRTLRRAVGITGMALPVVLVIGSVTFGGCMEIQNSISSYYHTNMRDVFVAILAATAFFLFAYKGYNHKDNIAGNIAAVFALGMAFFPESATEPLPPCIKETMKNNVINAIHYFSAGGFFLTLSYFSLFIFTQKDENPTEMKLKRNKIYRICGFIMIACIVLIAAYSVCSKSGGCKTVKTINPIFWLETVALWAFGFSWFTKGETIFVNKNE